MPLRITARVVAAPVVFVLDFHHDLRARGDGSRVVLVRVVDDDVRALRYSTTHGAGRLLEIVELALTSGAEHDHPVAERELRVNDRAVFRRHHEVLFESKRLAEPLDG